MRVVKSRPSNSLISFSPCGTRSSYRGMHMLFPRTDSVILRCVLMSASAWALRCMLCVFSTASFFFRFRCRWDRSELSCLCPRCPLLFDSWNITSRIRETHRSTECLPLSILSKTHRTLNVFQRQDDRFEGKSARTPSRTTCLRVRGNR